MAYDLKAVFSVQDRASATIRKITQEVNKLERAMKEVSSASQRMGTALRNNGNVMGQTTNNVNRVNNAYRTYNNTVNNVSTVVNRNTSTVNNNSSAVINNITQINRYSSASSRMAASAYTQNSALQSLRGTLTGLAGAYLGVQGAQKLFSSTVGGAAKYEQASVTLKAMIDDDALYKSYMGVIDKISIDSPLLNSADMVSGSKGLLALTKDLGTLEQSWKTIEKLNVLSPEAGVDGAVFALKELASSDIVSMAERFNIPKKFLHQIKGLSFDKQLNELDSMLAKMNITNDVVNQMGKTSLGQWNSLNERVATFMRQLGAEPNTVLGDVLFNLNDALGKLDTSKLAKSVGDAVGTGLKTVIDFTKKVWNMRETILSILKPIGMFAATVAGIVAATKGFGLITATLGFLVSPIGLLAGGILAVGAGFKYLYENSDGFRGTVAGTVGVAKSLFSAIGGGLNAVNQATQPLQDFFKTLNEKLTSGVFTGILDRDKDAVAAALSVAGKITSTIGKVGDFITTFKQAMSGGLFTGILDRDQGAVGLALGLADKIKTTFSTVKDYIANKVVELQPTFAMLSAGFTSTVSTITTILTTLWSIAGPVLSLLWNAIQILGDVVGIIFNNVIAPSFMFTTKLLSVMWSIAGPILSLFGAGIGVLGQIIKLMWDTILMPFVDYISSGLVGALEYVMPVLDKVGAVFQTIGGYIQYAAEKVSDFIGAVKNVKIPDIVSKLGSGAINLVNKVMPDVKGSHYNGATRIGTEGLYQLHVGERVLTRHDADNYDSVVGGLSYGQAQTGVTNNYSTVNNTSASGNGGSGGPRSVVLNMNGAIKVREETDIKKIADELYVLLSTGGMQYI
ncbi:phage tail protein [Solibacillus sp. FSL H8-0538]|uniref:phage tail protein n=1 Tax=Solibacillus sp. FSL H8-0538 TaxID=2921400 RepID=UPI0030F72BAB